MSIVTFLGYPRIGSQRALKRALESYWRGESSAKELLEVGRLLREEHWLVAHEAGADIVAVNDFSLYDHVLDTAALFDAIPARYRTLYDQNPLDGYFAMARGYQRDNVDLHALEMTKWFDTNYHYIVPELQPNQRFCLNGTKPIDELKEATAQRYQTRVTLLGPVSFLLLAKRTDNGDTLDLLDNLLPAYVQLLDALYQEGADWVQFDEPCLALDVNEATRAALEHAYQTLGKHARVRVLLANYFGGFGDALPWVLELPVDGIHADLVRGAHELDAILEHLPQTTVLSAGIIDGRNVWRSPLLKLFTRLQKAQQKLGSERLWLAPSCSLLHVPMDVNLEHKLDGQLCAWLSFARQKIEELRVLADALEGNDAALAAVAAQESRRGNRHGQRAVVRQDVRERTAQLTAKDAQRKSPYPQRYAAQQEKHPLPPLPTTTIGSFPQTDEVRKMRADHRNDRLSTHAYHEFLRQEITDAIAFQERAGLDVLVHGEAERNDMVEYFGEMLEGFAFTRFGWVQSYGSRCVKPPLIFGDVARTKPMTVPWSAYAQSLTSKPVKGMLTGPVTMLKWSFVRNDVPPDVVARQIALALRDEVQDLEKHGIHIIQIDEPAFREALPLRQKDWEDYFAWAVESFRIASSGVQDSTQIHTHMCYSEFNDILPAIADMDADVISIETSRSEMELLRAFADFEYPNAMGPGVYDIHSPRLPTTDEMLTRVHKALKVLAPAQLWINPDCGLKTRTWEEVEPALVRLVQAAQSARAQLAEAAQ